MIYVNIHQVKTGLSELLKKVERGEEVIITKRNRPVAKLSPIEGIRQERRIGTAKGKVHIADNFDVLIEDFSIDK
jgi:prevent-host-death family protein